MTPERIDKVYYIASGSNEAVIAPTHDDSAVLDLRNTGPGSLNWYATYSPFFAVDPDEGHLCDFGAEVITVSWDIPSPPGCSGIILFESNKGACTVEIHLEVIEMDDSSDPSESQIGPQNRRKQ